MNPLSTTTGTSLPTSPISYERPFQMGGDTISIQSTPGTGATTAETWSHEAQLAQQALNERKFAEDKARADREWAWTQGAQGREEQAYLRMNELARQEQERLARKEAGRLTVNGRVVGGLPGIQAFGQRGAGGYGASLGQYRNAAQGQDTQRRKAFETIYRPQLENEARTQWATGHMGGRTDTRMGAPGYALGKPASPYSNPIYGRPDLQPPGIPMRNGVPVYGGYY